MDKHVCYLVVTLLVLTGCQVTQSDQLAFVTNAAQSDEPVFELPDRCLISGGFGCPIDQVLLYPNELSFVIVNQLGVSVEFTNITSTSSLVSSQECDVQPREIIADGAQVRISCAVSDVSAGDRVDSGFTFEYRVVNESVRRVASVDILQTVQPRNNE